MTSRSPFMLALVAVLAAGCQGKTASKPQRAAAAKRDASPQFDAQTNPQSGEAQPSPAGADDDSAPQPGASAAADDPLGKRFIDPPWFRKTMLEGAKAVDVSRSEADDNGFFSSQILFELPQGTTAEQCADQLVDKVKDSVSDLERAPEGDRIKITGHSDRYRITFMCGEAKGVMRAYVSFEWFA